LKLYKDENGVEGLEYPIDANNKRVDILAIDQNNIPVVVEVKVSKGYEKVIGQCLYYRNHVKQMLNSEQARIIVIAREISNQLQTAVENLHDVELFEYKLSVKLERINKKKI
jgi:RecB family endonuclease NucS